MRRNTSISLGQHFQSFIEAQVESGRYGTASEVVRAGLRLLEDDQARLEALRAALERGHRSGFSERYSIERIIADVKRKGR
jgi:antitoxin ParD1/3/4